MCSDLHEEKKLAMEDMTKIQSIYAREELKPLPTYSPDTAVSSPAKKNPSPEKSQSSGQISPILTPKRYVIFRRTVPEKGEMIREYQLVELRIENAIGVSHCFRGSAGSAVQTFRPFSVEYHFVKCVIC